MGYSPWGWVSLKGNLVRSITAGLVMFSSNVAGWQPKIFQISPTAGDFHYQEATVVTGAEPRLPISTGYRMSEPEQAIPGWYSETNFQNVNHQGSHLPWRSAGNFDEVAPETNQLGGYTYREWRQPEPGFGAKIGETRLYYDTSEGRREYRFRATSEEQAEFKNARYQGWSRSPYRFRPTVERSGPVQNPAGGAGNSHYPLSPPEPVFLGYQEPGWHLRPRYPYFEEDGVYSPSEFYDSLPGFGGIGFH